MTQPSAYSFTPQDYEAELTAIISECEALEEVGGAELQAILRKHPKDGRGFFSKSEIIRGYRFLRQHRGLRSDESEFLDKMRMKPVRTLSGVAPVTVLTKPFPCPGRCIFCPSDVRMPKSYLSDEPGAQRAAEHQFDPYRQTLSRLLAYRNIGHRVDKVELIILGGTWSSYPEPYQRWFIQRCFEAMNDYRDDGAVTLDSDGRFDLDFRDLEERIDGDRMERGYNEIVVDFRAQYRSAEDEDADWADLERVQKRNETAHARCVGLVLETRPDHLSREEVWRLRRLGATKVQIGYQSLSDRVLVANHRGHDVEATRRSMLLLREAGFKIHAHWMPNLFGSTPADDVKDFERIFADPDFRPDELKIYPCSLIESAELMQYYRDGRWRPYNREELLQVLTACLRLTPPYCRVSRMIRDIPGTDIVVGNRTTNFRQLVEDELRTTRASIREIRWREVRSKRVQAEDLILDPVRYETNLGNEVFLQYVDREDRLAAFLRLSLPRARVPIPEIASSAMVREVHVYGRLVALGERENERPQHAGLGRALIKEAGRLAREGGFEDLAVISSVGTRPYYRRLGFMDGERYQHLRLS